MATPLLALQRDLGVDLEALADSDDRVAGAWSASAEAPNGEIVWEPATLRRAVEIMGFDPGDDSNLPEPGDGRTAAPCGPCSASPAPPSNCGSPESLAREALNVAAGCCGGGGGGGSPPPPPPPPPEEPPTSCVCCPVAVASGAEGSASSPDEAVANVNCCGADGACDDGDPCTDDDHCNGNPNYCPSEPAFTCCGRPKVCADDGDVCTLESCVGGACVTTDRNCDDGLRCTIDDCDPATGCYHTDKNCDDANVCSRDTCNPSTGACENPPNCSDPDRPKCCPDGSGSYCCTSSGGVCCDNPYHCCDSGKTCCPGGTDCCNPDQTCCKGQCGLKGACCFFDTGSCSERTATCCAQQGGTYQGDGSACTPADLCRPKCENCHAVNLTMHECGHYISNPLGPCAQDECFENVMLTASCDSFPYRKGPARCDTYEIVDVEEFVSKSYWLSIPEICETTNPGGFHPWQELYFGCGEACDLKPNPPTGVRCDTGPCGGRYFVGGDEKRGTKKACGCPSP